MPLAAALLLFAIAQPPQLPPGLIVPEAARPAQHLDVEKATQAYIDVLSAEQRARSDAYFEGGYWLQLGDFVNYLIIAAILLFTGLSRRMRDLAQRLLSKKFLSTWLYVVMWVVATFLLGLPMSIYGGYIREHQYGLSNLTFGGWMQETLIEFGLELLLMPLVIALIYAAVRRAGARWWMWASAITLVVAIFLGIIAPVVISPLFNKYTPLGPGRVRDEVLSLARANRIPATDVYVADESKQSNRVSANVQGLFGTTRISLNDNLLKNTSVAEIRAVLGHEMGHYVLHHGTRLLLYLILVLTVAFILLHSLFDRAIARWGTRFGIADRADPAGLPLATAILALLLTLMTPVLSTISRQAEAEADAFGINASREPHGFATAALRLSTYRKMKPGPLEEILFYDHPSGYDRIQRAMAWLAENPDDPRMLRSLAEAKH